jgi:hypothetical protein
MIKKALMTFYKKTYFEGQKIEVRLGQWQEVLFEAIL